MMFWYGNGNGVDGWGYVLMTVGMVLFWGVVIFGVIALVRYTARRQGPAQTHVPSPTPQQLLAERFARGEIDEHEYRIRLDVLHQAPRSPAAQ
ncbi:SHOCT domain-containing protein [Pseudonocardia sp. GCM10023141]|uniref:SHOCT domain-containing protein n=1 Tax=Pseudonocardia sp. GCM10023141 TaxID=3252653 RepID=UPI00360E6927